MTDEELDAALARDGIASNTVGDLLNLSFTEWENRQKVAELPPYAEYRVTLRYSATIPNELAKAYLKRLMTLEAKKLLRDTA